MNLDRTFCSGMRCGRKEQCDRWLGHLDKLIKDGFDHPKLGRLSVAQFDDGAGNCDMFNQVETDLSGRSSNESDK